MPRFILSLSTILLFVATIFGFAYPGSAIEVANGQSLFSNLLWLTAALLASIGCAIGNGTPVSINQFPAWMRYSCVALFVMIFMSTIATWLIGPQANYRSAINSVWQWIISGLIVYSVAVVSFAWSSNRGRFIRSVLLLIVMIGWCLSLHGLHQKLVEIPNDIAHYKEDPVAVLREAGIQAEKDSAVDLLFRGRLYDAAPTATYSLTNSLAIIMAIVFVACLAWSIDNLSNSIRILAPSLLVILLPVALCLLWTKSRTAWLAVLIGIAVLLVENHSLRALIRGRAKLVGIAIAAIAVCFAGAIAFWESSIFRDALDSLLYRTSYWWTSLRIVQDHMFLGVGPGNFQDYYAQYKPDLSAETVSDPHSLWFETLVVGGPLALLSLVVSVLFIVVGRIRQPATTAASISTSPADINNTVTTSGRLDLFTISAVAGVTFGVILPWFVFGLTGVLPDPTTYLFSIPIAGLLAWKFLDAIEISFSLSVATLDATLVTFITCLTFAGGWMTPGVSNVLFVLIGLMFSVNDASAPVVKKSNLAMVARLWPTALVAALLVSFLTSSWWPVQSSRSALITLQQSRQTPTQARLESLIATDPYNPELWQQAAAVEHAKCMQLLSASNAQLAKDSAFFTSFQKFSNESVQRNKQSWQAVTQRGNWRQDFAAFDPAWLSDAVADYETAVELYPGDVEVLMQAALGHFLMGDWKAADQRLTQAEQIDRETKHLDRRLFAGVIYWSNQYSRQLSKADRSATGLLWEQGRQLPGSDPNRIATEPLAKVMRTVLNAQMQQ